MAGAPLAVAHQPVSTLVRRIHSHHGSHRTKEASLLRPHWAHCATPQAVAALGSAAVLVLVLVQVQARALAQIQVLVLEEVVEHLMESLGSVRHLACHQR